MIPYRDDNPTYSVPYINYLLILLNVSVFFLEILYGYADRIFMNYGLIAGTFWQNPIIGFPRILSSMFVHGGWIHIIGNMLFLWIFGDNIEDIFGHFRYLFFYLGAGIVGAFVQMIFFPHSFVPMVGASGAISGVIAAYMIFFPNQRVSLFIVPVFRVKLPAFLFIGIWILMQVLSGAEIVGLRDVTGVAYFAHLGGIAFGLIIALTAGRKLHRKWKEAIRDKKPIGRRRRDAN